VSRESLVSRVPPSAGARCRLDDSPPGLVAFRKLPADRDVCVLHVTDVAPLLKSAALSLF